MVELPEGRDWEMVVFDVDGTLMDVDGYHPDLIPLIREVEARGLTVSLASGRTLPNVTPIKQSLGVSGFIVAENGGMVWDSDQGHEIVALADGSRARAAAQWLATQIDGFDDAGIESNRWRETEWCLYEREDAELMCQLLAYTEWSDLIVVSTGFAIHITAPGVDKASGLRVAFEQRGIDPVGSWSAAMPPTTSRCSRCAVSRWRSTTLTTASPRPLTCSQRHVVPRAQSSFCGP